MVTGKVASPRALSALRHTSIPKSAAAWRVTPNLLDYDEERRRFSWDAARAALDGLPGGAGLNIAHEAVDRHAAGALAGHLALRFLLRDGGVREMTFGELRERTNRFANVLGRLKVAPGDVVMTLAGRIPDLYVAALGTLKARCVFSPLFAAFGPEPIRSRIRLARARVLVTTPELYRRKIAPLRAQLPELQCVLLAGDPATGGRWSESPFSSMETTLEGEASEAGTTSSGSSSLCTSAFQRSARSAGVEPEVAPRWWMAA